MPANRRPRFPAPPLAAIGLLLAGACAPGGGEPPTAIERVERGLLPPILLAGETRERMALRDRMEP